MKDLFWRLRLAFAYLALAIEADYDYAKRNGGRHWRMLPLVALLLTGCGSVEELPWTFAPAIDRATYERAAAAWTPVARVELDMQRGVLIREAVQPGTEVGVWRRGARVIEVELFGDVEIDAQIVAHEMGHAFGLGHASQEPCALMSPNWCGAWLTPADVELYQERW